MGLANEWHFTSGSRSSSVGKYLNVTNSVRFDTGTATWDSMRPAWPVHLKPHDKRKMQFALRYDSSCKFDGWGGSPAPFFLGHVYHGPLSSHRSWEAKDEFWGSRLFGN